MMDDRGKIISFKLSETIKLQKQQKLLKTAKAFKILKEENFPWFNETSVKTAPE